MEKENKRPTFEKVVGEEEKNEENVKEKGIVVENLLENADEYGVNNNYVDKELLSSLMSLSVGDEIPNELYDIVSKVLVYVETVEKKYSN